MEYVGAISELEWNSFDGMCSDEANFVAQLLSNSSLANEIPSTFWPVNVNISGVDESSMYSLDETNTYSGGSSVLFPSLSHESFYMNVPHQIFVTNNNLMENKNNSSLVHILTNNVMVGGDDFLNQDVSNDSTYSNENFLQGKNITLGEEIETPIPDSLKKDKIRSPSEITRKRPRIVAGEFQQSKKNMKLKKFSKVDEDEDVNKNNHAVLHRQRSSTLCSEDDSNASHELCGVTSSSNKVPKSNGKTRASKGSATDPQSLYARKRRERINERLKILQNLVPNGTKVDISTMLEEAVQYVKFLQLQIKLLSSDDHWMYAPLAYNGMDIGLDVKISAQKS